MVYRGHSFTLSQTEGNVSIGRRTQASTSILLKSICLCVCGQMGMRLVMRDMRLVMREAL